MNYSAYKKIIDIDKNPWFIHSIQTKLGKSCALILFALLLWLNLGPGAVIAMYFVALITFFPNQRRLLLLYGTLIVAISGGLFLRWDDWQALVQNRDQEVKLFGLTIRPLEITMLTLLFLVSTLIKYLTARFQHVPWTQRHVVNLFVILLTLIFTAKSAGFSPSVVFYLWAFIFIFGHYLWYLAYSLHDIKQLRGKEFWYDFARFYPVWSGSNLPYPKGPAYLHHIEAKTSEEFAVTQLKAIKLIWWASTIYILRWLIIGDNNLDIPTLPQAITDYSKGIYYPWQLAWQCLLLNFVTLLLDLTINGHVIIAVCRMCGYRALRNTYKPLQATTIAEFWNRYYYYYKELVVDMFFYPTYFRYFKTQPRLRIFFATMATAAFGNALYHFLIILNPVRNIGLINALIGFQSYLFYVVLLGLGIACSQLRNLNKVKTPQSLPRKGLAISGVLSFYIFLSIFALTVQTTTIMVNFRFLFSLFNYTW